MKAKRFSRTDWIEFGLAELAAGGPPALTIDALCEASGKTRGSFYFHFSTMEDFHQSVADSWREQFTDQIISSTPIHTDRRDLLNLLAARIDLALESGMRRLAATSPDVAKTVAAADQDRIAWLASLYAETGDYKDGMARQLARIEYAAFAGFRLIEPDLEAIEARKLYEAFLTLTGRV